MAAARKKKTAAAVPAPKEDPVDLGVLSRVHLFPVRHHSPRTSAALQVFLQEVRPQVVLVEGPSDASNLIDVLVDDKTQPPVAVLGYRTDQTPDSALWPFAAYSPEWVALRWAVKQGVKAHFIDLTVGQALAAHGSELLQGHGALSPGPEEAEHEHEPLHEDSIYDRCAREYGHRSFDEFWEAMFEAPGYRPDQFRAALMAYAELVRVDSSRLYDRARDAVMTRHIAQVVAGGVEPGKVAVVLGAAHAAAMVAGEVDLELAKALPAPVPCAVTLIPYSFPRLAEQLGYGAGNRAPQYYQRAHDAGCDFRRATLEVLVEFTEHLRLRGFTASLADTIEAYRLAVALSDLRGKSGPGLDEVREATVATLCRGERAHVDDFLWPAVVGRRVGMVAQRIGKNSLQEEFWREVGARKLPRDDSPEGFILHLHNDVEIGTSTFLHRLRVAGIPYASFQGSAAGPARNRTGEEAGGHAALSRKREAWEAQWTPATETALVEKIVLGDTMEQVATHVLQEQLVAAHNTGQAAHVLTEAVVTGCPQTIVQALRACDAYAATDDDLPSLAQALRALSGLVAYGSSRGQKAGPEAQATPATEDVPEDVLVQLCRKTFDRGVLRVPDACTGNDDAVRPMLDALRTLHDIAKTQPQVDQTTWFDTAGSMAKSYALNPLCAGFACGLLFEAHVMPEADVVLLVGQRLSDVLEPLPASAFLEGFFQVNTMLLSRNRSVVQAIDLFLNGIDTDRFADVLPMLRRAFGQLGQTERRYLLENLMGLRQLGDKKRAAQAVLAEKDKEALKAMSADLEKAMDDLDDLL